MFVYFRSTYCPLLCSFFPDFWHVLQNCLRVSVSFWSSISVPAQCNLFSNCCGKLLLPVPAFFFSFFSLDYFHRGIKPGGISDIDFILLFFLSPLNSVRHLSDPFALNYSYPETSPFLSSHLPFLSLLLLWLVNCSFSLFSLFYVIFRIDLFFYVFNIFKSFSKHITVVFLLFLSWE